MCKSTKDFQHMQGQMRYLSNLLLILQRFLLILSLKARNHPNFHPILSYN